MRRAGLWLLLAVVAASCATEGPPDARSGGGSSETDGLPPAVTDAAGHRVELARSPQRIVSLVPSATRTLAALGLESRLVGRTDYDTVPPLDTLPSVGGGLRPSLERLVALDPDLVVRFQARSDRGTAQQLDRMGIPHLAVRPDGIDDVRTMIRTLGRVGGASRAADSLVARIDSALARVAATLKGRPRRSVAFVLGGEPTWVAGPGTYIDQLIEAAGGRNAFGDLAELYGPVSPEAFVARSIDVVLAAEGTDVRLPGVDLPLRRVPRAVERPGPGIGEAAWALARAIHPEAFP